MLLKTSKPTSAIEKTAEDFAEYSQTKIDNIRRATADAPPPVTVDRPCNRLSEFTEVTADEVSRISQALCAGPSSYMAR